MCQDEAINHLNRYHYLAVRLPRTGIEPMSLGAMKRRSIELFGSIYNAIAREPRAEGGRRLRPQMGTAQFSELTGKRSSEHELTVGLKFLDSLLKAVGFGGLGAELSFDNECTIAFRYGNISSYGCTPMSVATYLAECVPDPRHPVWEYMDHGKETGVLISAVLRSSEFSVEFFDRSGRALELNANAISEVVDASLEIGGERETEHTLTFHGPTPAIFAVKAHTIALKRADRAARLSFEQFAITGEETTVALATGFDEAGGHRSDGEAAIFRPVDRSGEVAALAREEGLVV